MKEFVDEDLTGASFESVDLTGARFADLRLVGVDIRGARLQDAEVRNVLVKGVRIRGVEIVDVELSGELVNVRVNGVDVGPLVEAELARRHPVYGRLKAATADGLREVWPMLEDLWAGTVARARVLEARDPRLLHESVDGEWSFIETLRHMLFVTDSWVRRGILGDPSPWHPLDLPWDEMPDTPGIPRDREVRPSLDEVLVVRSDRQTWLRELLAGITDARLAERTTPVPGPGWPPEHAFEVVEPLQVVLTEEWWHRRFAERDLRVLADRAGVELGPDEEEQE